MTKFILSLIVLALLPITASAEGVYFQLVDSKPVPNYDTWSLQGNTIQFSSPTVGSAGYAWSPVPQRMETGEQQYVQIAVRAQSLPNGSFNTGIEINGFGTGGSQEVSVTSQGGATMEDRKNVLLTAPLSGTPGDKLYLTIGAFYGISITYAYLTYAK